MALQSPTTLLSSIQYMKSKLRSDKQTLIDIKNDFTAFAKKPRQQQDVSSNQIITNSCDHDCVPVIEMPPTSTDRSKVLELKKQHQREMLRLKEEHERQLSELLKVKNQQLEDMENKWKCKLQQQAAYVSLLEDQVSSPVQTERQLPHQQYDTIINKMLQENTRLHEANQQLAQECNRLTQLCSQLDSDRTARSRFRFAKGRRQDSKASCYASENSQSQVQLQGHKRVSSVFLFNDENIDTSNCNQWEDMEINDEQGGLRTIRQFEKSVVENNHCRAKAEAYLSLKL